MPNHVHTLNYTPNGTPLLDSFGVYYSTWTFSMLNEIIHLKDNRCKGYHVGTNGFYVNSVCVDEVLMQNYTQHHKKEEKEQFTPSFSGWMFK